VAHFRLAAVNSKDKAIKKAIGKEVVGTHIEEEKGHFSFCGGNDLTFVCVLTML
jgi:hypothetical protein